MLDEAASSIDSDALIDDDDAIDKLLMENAFDEDEEEPEVEEDDFERLFAGDEAVNAVENIDEFADETVNAIEDFDEFADDVASTVEDLDEFADEAVSTVEEIDEFAEETETDETPEPATEAVETTPVAEPLTEVDRSNVSEDDAAMAEIDEFADFDEFGDFEPEQPIAPVKDENEAERLPEPEPQFDTDDFTLAEFDISDPEEKANEAASALPDVDLDEVVAEFQLTDDLDDDFAPEVVEQEPETGLEPESSFFDDNTALEEEQGFEQPSETKPVVDEGLVNQIGQLLSEQALLKQQIADLQTASHPNPGLTEEIDRLSKSQNQLKKQLDSGKKPHPVTYVALGVGVVAMALAGLFAYFGSTTDEELQALTETVATLEETQAELHASMMQSKAENNTQSAMPVLPLSQPQPVVDPVAALTPSVQSVLEPTPVVPAQEPVVAAQPAEPPPISGSGEAKPALPEAEAAVKTEQPSTPPEEPKSDKRITELEAKVKELEAKLAASKAKPAAAKTSRMAPVPTPAPVRKATQSVPIVRNTESWSVNLVSFKQDWYANRKAAEFARQGVNARVTRVQVKGETWYRLSVSGFRNRNEATAYAARIRKVHNLDSVWVAKD
ncbi:MAG: hypothetical protein Kow0065_07000 [Methylomicrobium sp.]